MNLSYNRGFCLTDEKIKDFAYILGESSNAPKPPDNIFRFPEPDINAITVVYLLYLQSKQGGTHREKNSMHTLSASNIDSRQ